MLQYRHLTKPGVKEAQYAFAINLCEHATKKSFFTYQHIHHALKQPKKKKIFNNPRLRRIEFTFDCASTYVSEEMVYNLTYGFAKEMLPRRFDSVRFSPQCHCHGKSNLDRRFSSLTTWKKTWEDDEFHSTIMNIDDLQACYIDGRDLSNEARVTVDHKEPLITEISKIKLKVDRKKYRPYVHIYGVKSTNAITLITNDSYIKSRWKLINNVLPQVPDERGEDITASICEGRSGKPVTDTMKNPGTKRKTIKQDDDETNPKVVESQFLKRKRFIERGNLEYYLKHQLQIVI